jgi:hypothetical protein
MRMRLTALLAAVMFVAASPVFGQVQSGEITGKVTDNTGAILPGATVTLTGATLIQPQTATTSETGTYNFPRLPIGTYTVKFELPGFKTVVREDVRLTLGFTAQIDQQLDISTVQETVTVSGESPVVDTKSTTARTTFDLEMLQNLPSARDPWVMLERVPNITMDRINVGGSQSGQQSSYISRGATTTNNKWSLDGVDITDMSATGASPIYYDFDMLQEMQVTTGGADASQQTGGVGINFVTRSGTNRFKGSGRLYNTNERFEADNITPEIRAAGAGSGAPIQNINDFGFEVGGPIKRDKLWFWGSYGKQDIKVGVVGFYKRTDFCRPPGMTPAQISARARTLSTEELRGCLATDLTTLNNYNWKITWTPLRNNRFNFQNTWAEKVRNARDASDTRPLETAYRQKAVDKTFGPFGWETGPGPVWKGSDQHVFSDRFLAEIQLAHIGNNFTLTFQEPAQRDIQATFDIATGNWGRSYDESIFLRPTDSIDLTSSYFLPAALGGDHAFKAGYRYRWARGESITHTGGNAQARFSTIDNPCATTAAGCNVDLWRDGWTDYALYTHAAYIQDAFTLNRLTLNLGVRWDRQSDEALPTTVPANPLFPSLMPAINFPGINAGVVWNDVSPRLGFTYDLSGVGKSLLRGSYSLYFGQMSPGQLSGQLVAISQVFVRYPWVDTNGDKFVQAGEVDTSVPFLSKSSAFDPANPTAFTSPGRVDPNIKNDRTREFIVGYQHELLRNLGIEANYVWRKYDQFTWSDRDNWDANNFTALTFTPPCTGKAICTGPVTYYRPSTVALPSPYLRTNQPDRFRNYNGVELAMTKRYSDRWMANLSFAFNDAKDYWDSLRSYGNAGPGTATAEGDPTNISMLHGREYAPESGGSGIDNIFNNAKWLTKASGSYLLPWFDINLAGNVQFRQGNPFPIGVNVTNRTVFATGGGGGLGDTVVLMEPLGERRLDNIFVADFKVEKAFTFGTTRIVPSMDIFNLTNANTVLAYRRVMYTLNAGTGVSSQPANANDVSGIIAPRVIRFGVRVNW